eukprot:scaffold197122_cov20-Tisochrysis_lutea.AAC.1
MVSDVSPAVTLMSAGAYGKVPSRARSFVQLCILRCMKLSTLCNRLRGHSSKTWRRLLRVTSLHTLIKSFCKLGLISIASLTSIA